MYWAECDNQQKEPQVIKKASFIISVLFTFCLSLQNFFPVHRTVTIQTIKESWCYGNSRDTYMFLRSGDEIIT